MKCPKCGYVGFERVERCRNCGYDFSLCQGDGDIFTSSGTKISPSAFLPELPIRFGDAGEMNPLEDLALVDAAVPPQPPPTGNTSELPLFARPSENDEPLITKPSPPRPPLAVRRATLEVPRLRTDSRPILPMLELTQAEMESRLPGAPARGRTAEWNAEAPVESPVAAGVVARMCAVAIDLVVLAGIDLLVVYFTVKICGLTAAEIGILPKGPLVAFLLVQNAGYLVAFTAGGQTLGKMAAGIRVVPSNPNDPLDLAHSIVRTAVWVVLAVPAGLGFVTALFSRDHRGLHDRCAGTRVVRASA